ncbi:ORF6N domain-containing protein [Sphingobacterium corticibacterium]|uniref:ORF6N domain-containing protein n=1 Tax=Sphingobacterium corticibacterium TaxID=2484746 RepID=A0A4Q6XYU5_9SPHI|nr:ORF6N domain-containing protein [Sphingobacterium corticibacterium]RZF62554.1 ORF6N domain-containing protein [Sphingobacterium corticibacterium]
MYTELKAVAIADDVLANKIYEFRGQKVMLDSDLAELYGVETKVLKQTVRRNIDRFPEDFMFELNDDEFKFLRSQIVTSKTDGRGGSRYTPMTFTEQGVAMLSSVLRSKLAIQTNIQIMRVFTKLRQFLTDNSRMQHELTEMRLAIEKLSKKQKGHDQNIELLFEYIDRLQENTPHTSSKGVTVVKGFDVGSKKNN